MATGRKVTIPNPHIQPRDSPENVILHHLGITRHAHDIAAMFGDVKYVCIGGTGHRMKEVIEHMTEILELEPTDGFIDYCIHANRFSLYKNGPVIAVSHGMGFASVSILLNEIIKLLYYADATDVFMFRIGTCGGIGVPAGTVIVTENAIDGQFRSIYEQPVLGQLISREAIMDREVADGLVGCSEDSDLFNICKGTTMSTADFFEGQCRMDGVFCSYNLQDKIKFLTKLQERGVKNIEMEAVLLASVCHRVGIKLGIVCVALLDRLKGDIIIHNSDISPQELEKRAMVVVGRYIKKLYSGSL